MANEALDIQGAWDPDPIRQDWDLRLDWRFVLRRMNDAALETVSCGGTGGRLLEVGSAEATHACHLARRGFDTVVIEPSPMMLARARQSMTAFDTTVALVRGIAEALPFPGGTFDCVLCDSAIDHFASPDLGAREMTRVLKPDGRLVLSFVNYRGVAVRLSRLVYQVERAFLPRTRTEHRFWDSPVPAEHVFEASMPAVEAMCGQYLTLERAVGVSLGWQVPGWSHLLARLDEARAERLLARLDRAVRRRPSLADFVVSVWRPRREGPARIAPGRRRVDGRMVPDGGTPLRLETLRVTPGDPVYRDAVLVERDYPHDWLLSGLDPAALAAWERFQNEQLTGDPGRSWLDDLIARGPVQRAAALGCDGTAAVTGWLRARASAELDVYDLSGRQLGRMARAVAAEPSGVQLRLVETDLNLARLPPSTYDVIWSAGTLRHLYNLEHVLEEIDRALRPGGLFVLYDCVVERRHRYSEHRITRVNALVAEMPARFRLRRQPLTPVDSMLLSPFCAVRSDDMTRLVRERFDIVHDRTTGYLAPLGHLLDLHAMEREAPELLARVRDAEVAARDDPHLRPWSAWLVGRRRAA